MDDSLSGLNLGLFSRKASLPTNLSALLHVEVEYLENLSETDTSESHIKSKLICCSLI